MIQEMPYHCHGLYDEFDHQPISLIPVTAKRFNHVTAIYTTLQQETAFGSFYGSEAECLQRYDDLFRSRWTCKNPKKQEQVAPVPVTLDTKDKKNKKDDKRNNNNKNPSKSNRGKDR